MWQGHARDTCKSNDSHLCSTWHYKMRYQIYSFHLHKNFKPLFHNERYEGNIEQSSYILHYVSQWCRAFVLFWQEEGKIHENHEHLFSSFNISLMLNLWKLLLLPSVICFQNWFMIAVITLIAISHYLLPVGTVLSKDVYTALSEYFIERKTLLRLSLNVRNVYKCQYTLKATWK